MKTRAKAFTLVEILVVLAIIALLSAILLGVFGRVRENGRRATCQSNLRQLNLALRQYLSDNDAVYPDYKSWPTAILPYARAKSGFECPTQGSDAPPVWSADYQTDYELNGTFLNNFSTEKWRGSGESKVAHLDSSRLWTLADSAPSADSPEKNGEVPSPCHGGVGTVVVALVRHANGSNYAFADGHVKWLSTHDFADIDCYLTKALP